MKRWKSEMRQDYLENTWLDGRNDETACKYEAGHQKCCKLHQNGGAGASSGDPYNGGGGPATRNTAAYIHI